MNNIKLLERKIDKAEVEAYKVKRKARRVLMSWKVKAFAILLGGMLASLMMFIAFYNMSCWYDKNKVSFQKPIIFRPPVIIEAREVQVATKGATPILAVNVDANLPIINDLYRKIEFKESNNGMNMSNPDNLHNYCQRIGKVNTIGWIPKKGEKFCFADYGQQWETFKEVFDSRLKVMTINEAVCIHNTGTKQPMCNYSMELDTIK